MKQIYFCCFSVVLLLSCTAAKIDYVGSSHSPTQKIDVFVDERSIPRDYLIIGKGYERPNWRGMIYPEKMLEKAIEKARLKGADAVFYKEVYIPAEGTNLSSYSRTDTMGKSIITNSSTAISPVYGFWRKEILFIRYK